MAQGAWIYAKMSHIKIVGLITEMVYKFGA